jgi:hypothetical protein
MSPPPTPPGRLDSKKSDRPSAEMCANPSINELLTVDPIFTGVPQSSSFVGRLVTHMSQPPYPPDRFETKYISKPSDEKQVTASPDELLTIGPILVGVPQVKSASAMPVGKPAPNTKTDMAKILVVFIFLSFQKGLILSRRTLCAALFIAVLLLKSRLFGLIGPTLINRKKKAT